MLIRVGIQCWHVGEACETSGTVRLLSLALVTVGVGAFVLECVEEC